MECLCQTLRPLSHIYWAPDSLRLVSLCLRSLCGTFSEQHCSPFWAVCQDVEICSRTAALYSTTAERTGMRLRINGDKTALALLFKACNEGFCIAAFCSVVVVSPASPASLTAYIISAAGQPQASPSVWQTGCWWSKEAICLHKKRQPGPSKQRWALTPTPDSAVRLSRTSVDSSAPPAHVQLGCTVCAVAVSGSWYLQLLAPRHISLQGCSPSQMLVQIPHQQVQLQ